MDANFRFYFYVTTYNTLKARCDYRPTRSDTLNGHRTVHTSCAMFNNPIGMKASSHNRSLTIHTRFFILFIFCFGLFSFLFILFFLPIFPRAFVSFSSFSSFSFVGVLFFSFHFKGILLGVVGCFEIFRQKNSKKKTAKKRKEQEKRNKNKENNDLCFPFFLVALFLFLAKTEANG